MDAKRLKHILSMHNDTQDDLARYLEIGVQSVNFKINDRRLFKLAEVRKIKERYNLSGKDVYDIFIADA